MDAGDLKAARADFQKVLDLNPSAALRDQVERRLQALDAP
jgi:cytochrome c-type biogenesis protein CcmH/NrfG